MSSFSPSTRKWPIIAASRSWRLIATLRNLIPSKEFFFFGSDAVEPKSLAAYQKSEKSVETAHSNIAWAAHTGKGLLFSGDVKAPTGLINLVSYELHEHFIFATGRLTPSSTG